MTTKSTSFKRVLIIDDTQVDRYIAERNIKKYLFSEEVTVKESGRKALDFLKSLEGTPELMPECIFLDIRMPEMDGFAFLNEFEKLPVAIKSNCVILMLSSSLNPVDYEKALAHKVVKKFLNKPLDKEKLESLVVEFTS